MDIGTGEIIDASSRAGETRNQHDVVLYRRDYPRIPLGGSVHGFLVDSVVATVEVKSRLTKAGLRKAVRAAIAFKSLSPTYRDTQQAGIYRPPGPLSFVLAFSGPTDISTVHTWLNGIHKDLKVCQPTLKAKGTQR